MDMVVNVPVEHPLQGGRVGRSTAAGHDHPKRHCSATGSRWERRTPALEALRRKGNAAWHRARASAWVWSLHASARRHHHARRTNHALRLIWARPRRRPEAGVHRGSLHPRGVIRGQADAGDKLRCLTTLRTWCPHACRTHRAACPHLCLQQLVLENPPLLFRVAKNFLALQETRLLEFFQTVGLLRLFFHDHPQHRLVPLFARGALLFFSSQPLLELLHLFCAALLLDVLSLIHLLLESLLLFGFLRLFPSLVLGLLLRNQFELALPIALNIV
mmetsp:Transcript_43455/g.120236  ORF Transcript_43455/g.120236 Transcript_43455/m.120236 type:complete len:274 (-) Transcript_43455:1237-2058(-)